MVSIAVLHDLHTSEGAFQAVNFSSFLAPSQGHRSHPNSFLFFFSPTWSHEDFLALSAV